ncbi:MAG: SUMF1/EgtB/PvdO family nonheme iron enzyme [Planctomycetes bacterium]|nr:SUMF1/EgtB/PvdO family nonheme iron enzyme [Planctomycetota bacterium]
MEPTSSTQPTTAPDEKSGDRARVPERLGDFKIIREVGRGGMGIVFEAEQISLGRRVAVKVLPPSFTQDKQAVERFVTEARAAARLQHRNIVPVYAVGEEAGFHYYAMEFVKGQSLSQLLDEARKEPDSATFYRSTATMIRKSASAATASATTAPVAVPTTSLARDRENYLSWVCRIIAEVADALDFAHKNDVLHRDVKPNNIVVDERGVPMLLDFGLARIERSEKLTTTGEFLGTPAYMSREQILGKTQLIGPKSEVYSLGVTLYELVTLKLPYAGASPIEVIRNALAKEPIPPRQANPRLPEDLETIILTSIEHDLARRYATAADFAADLRRFMSFQPIQAKPATTWVRFRKFTRRNRAATIGAGVSGAAVLALLAFWIGGVISKHARIRGEFETARVSAASFDFDVAEAAMNRVLALDASNASASASIRDYRREREKQAAEKLEAQNQAAIDKQLSASEAIAAQASRLFDEAKDKRKSATESDIPKDVGINRLEVADKIAEGARAALNKAAESFIEAGTLPTSTNYKRDQIEDRIVALSIQMIHEAEAAGDRRRVEEAGNRAVFHNHGRNREIDRMVLGTGTLTLRCDVAGAEAFLFEYYDDTEETSRYGSRVVPMPVSIPSPTGKDPLGTTLADDVEHVTLGSLGIPTQAEIDAALRTRDDSGPPPKVVADDQVFARCRLPALPLQKVPIAMGSYLIVIRARGYVDLRLPIVVTRNEDVDVSPTMLREDQVPPGFVYVPAGTSILFGGVQTNLTQPEKRARVDSFLIGEREVTVGEYEAFFKDLIESKKGDDEIRSRAPKNDQGVPVWASADDGSLEKRTNWRPDQPMRRVSIAAAAAYCEWLSKKTGASIRLPTEEEWERAARGADGRIFPWGHAFLPQFCHVRDTTSPPTEDRAFWMCLADVSPFGVHDMAGGVSNFCGPVTLDANGSLPAKAVFFAHGGNWTQPTRLTCSATIRLARDPRDIHPGVGFRIVRDL